MDKNKIIDFNEILKKEENNEDTECMCGHCEVRHGIVDSQFMSIIGILKEHADDKNDDDLIDDMLVMLHEYYTDIFDEGKRSAYEDLIGFATHNIDHIDGNIEED